MNNLIEYEDMFGISKRLKTIDSSYVLYFNRRYKRYEVHTKCDSTSVLAVICPYDRVDKRLIDYVRKTRTERRDEIFAEIEKNNEKIEQNERKNAINNIKDVLSDIKQYLKGEEIRHVGT